MTDWWDQYKHCLKCCLYIDMGSDSIDAYKGCAKTKTVDYRLKECPLSERLYKELNGFEVPDTPRGRVFIDEKRLAKLLESDAFLDKLYAAGVDSWDGYEIAQDMED